MFKVNNDWGKLKVCVVGKAYNPGYFNWIKDREIIETLDSIMSETEEDLLELISLLESFNIKVIRPLLPDDDGKFVKPIIAPRDHMAMIGIRFFIDIRTGLIVQGLGKTRQMAPICNMVRDAGNEIITDKSIHSSNYLKLSDAFIWSVTDHLEQELLELTETDHKKLLLLTLKSNKDRSVKNFNDLIPKTKHQIIDSYGRIKSKVSLINHDTISMISDKNLVSILNNQFSNIIFAENHHDYKIAFNELCRNNGGKWWEQDHEYDHMLGKFIHLYYKHWTKTTHPTCYDSEILMIDPNNAVSVQTSEYNRSKLQNKGVKLHIINFRHRFFWDAGILRLTLDLDRED